MFFWGVLHRWTKTYRTDDPYDIQSKLNPSNVWKGSALQLVGRSPMIEKRKDSCAPQSSDMTLWHCDMHAAEKSHTEWKPCGTGPLSHQTQPVSPRKVPDAHYHMGYPYYLCAPWTKVTRRSMGRSAHCSGRDIKSLHQMYWYELLWCVLSSSFYRQPCFLPKWSHNITTATPKNTCQKA